MVIPIDAPIGYELHQHSPAWCLALVRRHRGLSVQLVGAIGDGAWTASAAITITWLRSRYAGI
jgi:hypothetical protein